MVKIYTVSFFLLMAIAACTPKVTQRFCTQSDVQYREEMTQEKTTKSPCYEYLHYAPDTNKLRHYPVKYIRVNFHFMNSSDSLNNFSEKEGVAWAKEYLKAGNYALNKNVPSLLPQGNNIPVLPLRYAYKLTPRPTDPNDDGIYFHYDDETYFYVSKGKDQNIYDKSNFEKYGIQKDTVLNIFIMPHHPDSIKSKTYGAFGTGIALGKFIKIGGRFAKGKAKEINPWEIRGTLNHEIAHVFGLVHAWAYNDGCDDTPRHSLDVTSNNIMDYNSQQLAFTPCQIGKIHQRMSMPESAARRLLEKNWCHLDENKNIIIRDSTAWLAAKDLEGNLIIEEGATLLIRCRLSIPKNGEILVKAGGKLILQNAWLHNDCGDKWKGIQIQEKGHEKGEVIFIKYPKLTDMQHPIAPIRP